MDIILYRTFFTFYIINLADIQKSGMEFRESILIVSFFKTFSNGAGIVFIVQLLVQTHTTYYFFEVVPEVSNRLVQLFTIVKSLTVLKKLLTNFNAPKNQLAHKSPTHLGQFRSIS